LLGSVCFVRARDALKIALCRPAPGAEGVAICSHGSREVKTAVSTLSDQELAQLASRSTKAQADFAAGRIEDHDLLVILVAIAALVLIIIAVR